MKRYETMEIGGKHFALALTIQSEGDIREKYGEERNVNEILYTGNVKEICENTIAIMEIMANEGATYAEMFEGKFYDRTTQEELRHMLQLADINDVREKLTNACILAWKRDIELEEDEKNADAPAK